jgi:hypothetical protein
MTAVVLLALSLTATPKSGRSDCVLPQADDREGQSEPNFDGVIGSVRGNDILLRLKHPHSKAVTVSLQKNSELFTVYGGYVGRSELKVGQQVRVWLEGCGRGPERSRRGVAVMELASTRPGDEFP